MFSARLATAAVLLAACISALLLLPNPWWTAAILPVLAIGAWEWAGLAAFAPPRRWLFAAAVVGMGLGAVMVSMASSRPGALASAEMLIYGTGVGFWLLVAPVWLVQGWRVRSAAWLSVTGCLVLIPAWLALVRLQSEPERLLALLGVIWVSDTAAYAAGRAWGRHKLAPAISPGKTWEGVAGAAAAVAVYYVAVSRVAPSWGWDTAAGAFLFASIAALGIGGDLFESWVKRQAAVKDSGTWLPGHGGVLDRIDSLTAALPAAALLVLFAR